MSTPQSYLELRIDVFELRGQRALARAELAPAELVAAVLDEFRELAYLGREAAHYELVHATDRTPLDEARSIGAQLAAGIQLVLIERTLPLPAGAVRPAQPAYLRERASGQVFPLAWIPALIGRPAEGLEDNEQIAVNLASHPAGQRVSRRHARLLVRDGGYLVERLSPNPTAIIDSAGRTIPVGDTPVAIEPGDTLLLERSQIALTLVVREV